MSKLLIMMIAAAGLSCAADVCKDALEGIVRSPQKSLNSADVVRRLLLEVVQPANAPGCLSQLLKVDLDLNNARRNNRTENRRARAVQQSLQGRLGNQQLSSSTSSQGSTSPISKPGSSPLSMVEDFTGVSTSTQSSTTTFQISPYKLPSELASKGWIPYCNQEIAISRDCVHFVSLARLSFTVSADLNTSAQTVSAQPATGSSSSGSTQEVTAKASGSSGPNFGGAGAKYVLWYQKGQQTAPDFSLIDFTAEDTRINQLFTDLSAHPLLPAWTNCLTAELNSAVWADDVHSSMKSLPAALKALDAALADYEKIADIVRDLPFTSCNGIAVPPLSASDLARLPAASKAIVNDLGLVIVELDKTSAQIDAAILASMTTPAASIEYDYSTPLNQPTYSTAKFAFSWVHNMDLTNATHNSGSSNPSCPFTQNSSPPAAAKGAPKSKTSSVACPLWTLTLNAGVSWYSVAPASSIPGASQLRDAQIGLEWDRNINSSKWKGFGQLIGDSTFSASYYYQDQTSPSILNVTPGSPSNGITLIGLPSTASQVFAAKGNINFAQLKYGFGTGTNVHFPIAVSWSNRTELIQHSGWGAQIGVSYDFSSLLGSGGAGNTKAQ